MDVIVADLQDISIGFALIRVLELGIADEDGVHVATCILVEFALIGDHDDGYLHIAKNAELIGLLEQARLALAEGYLRETREEN